MKRASPFQISLFITASIILGLVLVSCLATGGVYNSLVFRHERAYQRWQAVKPNHYRYNLAFLGDLTYQDYMVEVSGGNLVRLTDLNTGIGTAIPGTASTSFLPTNAWIRTNLLIDDLFTRIQGAIRRPKSFYALVSRTNPAFYARLSTTGWMPTGLATCDPPYPQVRYHPVYGYPEDLFLSGDPCTMMVEFNTPVRVKIDGFQPLP
jgi:hypothetical protein